MAPLLTLIFRASLHQQLSTDWKTACFSPVLKKGSRKNPANYKPISLTSIPLNIYYIAQYINILRETVFV